MNTVEIDQTLNLLFMPKFASMAITHKYAQVLCAFLILNIMQLFEFKKNKIRFMKLVEPSNNVEIEFINYLTKKKRK